MTIRDEVRYGRPAVMTWSEDHGVDYIPGLPGSKVRDRLVEPVADPARIRPALIQVPELRRCTDAHYGTKSWRPERRVDARIEETRKGLDIRSMRSTRRPGGTSRRR